MKRILVLLLMMFNTHSFSSENKKLIVMKNENSKLIEEIKYSKSLIDIKRLIENYGGKYTYLKKQQIPNTRIVDNKVESLPSNIDGLLIGTIENFYESENAKLSFKVYFYCENKVEKILLEKIFDKSRLIKDLH